MPNVPEFFCRWVYAPENHITLTIRPLLGHKGAVVCGVLSGCLAVSRVNFETLKRFRCSTATLGQSVDRPDSRMKRLNTPSRSAPSATARDWDEWREKCSADRCRPAVACRLKAFARSRFCILVRRLAGGAGFRNPAELMFDADDAWHLLETHIAISKTAGGLPYKNWLAARAQGDGESRRDFIESGAFLLLRDAIRNRLRMEFPRAESVSIDQPLCAPGGELTLGDMLSGGPDPAEEASRLEYDRLSERHAREMFEESNFRERVAILARGLGMPLSSPAVLRVARCRKTVLSMTHRAFLERMAAILKFRYRNDGMDAVRQLALLTFGRLSDAVFLWGKTENTTRHLFKIVEGDGVASAPPGTEGHHQPPANRERLGMKQDVGYR